MIHYLLRRLIASVVLLLLCSILIFVGLRVIPGDPISILASTPGFTPSTLHTIKHQLGLDQSIPHQYVSWVWGVLHGNFGYTYYNPNFTAQRLIGARIWPTVELTIFATLVAIIIAVPLGILSSMRPFGRTDKFVSGFATSTIALPAFWVAVLLIAAFAVKLSWFPTRGYTSIFHHPIANLRLIALPAISLGIVLSGPILLFLRASMLETMSEEFVRTARGKGLIWRDVVLRHVFPNALLPTLTVIGLLVGSMLGGVVITEYIFGWPGLGSLVMDAVGKRDYAVLQALLLLAAAAFVAVSLMVDLISFAIDPRLRADL